MLLTTFADQSRHYFERPSIGRPDGPVTSPGAWRGPELEADPARWRHELPAEAIEELRHNADRLIADDVPLAEVTAENFPLPSLEGRIAEWRETLGRGLGVVCLRRFPVREWGIERTEYAYWGLGHHLGSPGAQNPQGDLLGHVRDEHEKADTPLVRLYRTNDEIAFHCDAADVVGLLCLRTARRGGQSRIASSVSVYNALVESDPELAAALFEPVDMDRRGEEASGQAPTYHVTPARWDGTALRTFWHSDYMRSSARHGVEFSATRQALLDRYEALANSPELRFDMWLEEGDIQFISNHTVVHARSGYEDHDDPAEQRHLLRLWLTLDAPTERSDHG